MPGPLFVYGTLRRGSEHPAAAWLREGAVWLGAARVNGRLSLVDDAGFRYPALHIGGDEWVTGDLYQIDDAVLWRRLDDYEGDDFRLMEIKLDAPSGSVPAVVYVRRQGAPEGPVIPGGDWLAFLDWNAGAS